MLSVLSGGLGLLARRGDGELMALSTESLALRRTLITATDASAICGVMARPKVPNPATRVMLDADMLRAMHAKYTFAKLRALLRGVGDDKIHEALTSTPMIAATAERVRDAIRSAWAKEGENHAAVA